MKTLFLITLLAITVICTGQVQIIIPTHKDGEPVGNSKPQKRLKVNYLPTGGQSGLMNSIIDEKTGKTTTYKCSKCGNTVPYYMGTTKTEPLKLIYKCPKCGNIDKVLPTKSTEKFETYTQYTLYVSGKLVDLNTTEGRNEYLLVNRNTFETAKITIESNGKFTINLDGFKATDTIWIQAGKRKVGIPAYKFLEYFKNEPTIINTWPGRSIIVPNGLIPQ